MTSAPAQGAWQGYLGQLGNGAGYHSFANGQPRRSNDTSAFMVFGFHNPSAFQTCRVSCGTPFAAGVSYQAYYSSGNILAGGGGMADTTVGANQPLNTLAVTHTGTSGVLSLNGGTDSSVTATSTTYSGAQTYRVGATLTAGGLLAAGSYIVFAAIWQRVLSRDERLWLQQYWPLLLRQEPIWLPLTASGITGTSATTNANDTSNASGTTTVVGSSATANANDTSAANGTTTIVGTSATTNANDTSAASGSVGGAVTGTSATTNANDTSSASGTTTIVGASATTNADDTSSASGTVGGGVIGTSDTTNANDTSAASGTTTVTGSSATTNANDTSEAAGWAGTVTGTSATANANDISAASGTAGGGYSPPSQRTAFGGGGRELREIFDKPKKREERTRPEGETTSELINDLVGKTLAEKKASATIPIPAAKPVPKRVAEAAQPEPAKAALTTPNPLTPEILTLLPTLPALVKSLETLRDELQGMKDEMEERQVAELLLR